MTMMPIMGRYPQERPPVERVKRKLVAEVFVQVEQFGEEAGG